MLRVIAINLAAMIVAAICAVAISALLGLSGDAAFMVGMLCVVVGGAAGFVSATT